MWSANNHTHKWMAFAYLWNFAQKRAQRAHDNPHMPNKI